MLFIEKQLKDYIQSFLAGISQRETTSFYDHIGHEKESIVNDISTFFKENIQHVFTEVNCK
jgi:D123